MNLHDLAERNNLVARLRRIEDVALAELIDHRKTHGCAGISCEAHGVLEHVWSASAHAIVKATKERREQLQRTSHQG